MLDDGLPRGNDTHEDMEAGGSARRQVMTTIFKVTPTYFSTSLVT